MIYLRKLIRRGISRRLVAVAVLVAQVLTGSGIPLPAGYAEASTAARDLADQLYRYENLALLALVATEPAEIDRLWEVREGALPNLYALRGTAQPLPRIAHRRLAERARDLFDARQQIRLAAADRPDVLRRLRSLRGLHASIDLPGGHDDLLLRVHEVVDRPRVTGAGHRLALRQ